MFSPSRVRVVKAGQNKSAPSPAQSQALSQRDEALSNSLRGTTRFPPTMRAALKRRNGARRPVLVGACRRSRRPLRSELRHSPTRKPFQPVKLLSLLWDGVRTLSVAAFRVYSDLLVLITMCYLSTFSAALQAQAEIFREIGVFACLFARLMISLTQRFTESEVHPYGLGCRFLLPERKSLSILSSKCTLLSLSAKCGA